MSLGPKILNRQELLATWAALAPSERFEEGDPVYARHPASIEGAFPATYNGYLRQDERQGHVVSVTFMGDKGPTEVPLVNLYRLDEVDFPEDTKVFVKGKDGRIHEGVVVNSSNTLSAKFSYDSGGKIRPPTNLTVTVCYSDENALLCYERLDVPVSKVMSERILVGGKSQSRNVTVLNEEDCSFAVTMGPFEEPVIVSL